MKGYLKILALQISEKLEFQVAFFLPDQAADAFQKSRGGSSTGWTMPVRTA